MALEAQRRRHPPRSRASARIAALEQNVTALPMVEEDSSVTAAEGHVAMALKAKESLSASPPPPPLPTEEQRRQLRSMWQLASVLNFLHVFRPVVEINVKFSAEDLENALITPNATLADIHIPLLKAVVPAGRIPFGHDMWVTLLCKILQNWWPWVAEGKVPIVASHGEEIAAYKELDPANRLLILKALCEIRVEQDDIRNYIDDTLKHGGQFSTFHKERIEGNAYGISYWYDDDSTIGHRLYREIQKIQVKTKTKENGSLSDPFVTCQWETIATNLEEFQAVLENLASSRSKVDDGLGKKLKNDILPLLEKIQKRKEQALKRKQRHAMLLDGFPITRVTTGHSLRDRKPVSYTFDDYDRSIEEALQIAK